MGIGRLAGGGGARSSWLLAGALLLVAQSLACSVEDLPTPASGPPIDPRISLRQAVARVLALDSVAFTLEHPTGTTGLLPGLEMSKAYGVVDIPDKYSLTVEAEFTPIRSYVEVSVVTIGDQTFMTDPLSGVWREVEPGSIPVNFANLGQTLAGIIEAVDKPVLAGAECLKGRDTYRITGSIQSQDLSALVPNAGEDFQVDLELWLEQSDSLLLQVLIAGKVVPTDIPDTLRLLTLADFDVPVDITPPE